MFYPFCRIWGGRVGKLAEPLIDISAQMMCSREVDAFSMSFPISLFFLLFFFLIILIFPELPHPSLRQAELSIWFDLSSSALPFNSWLIKPNLQSLAQTTKAGWGLRSCSNYCQVFAWPIWFYASPSHKDMYPEIKDPSAFLWEVSWRHVGWFGILRKLWTLCEEQAICLCKNVSLCADESFSSTLIFQGPLIDLGLFFQQIMIRFLW